MTVNETGIIAKTQEQSIAEKTNGAAKQSVALLMNNFLDGEKMRSRFDDLLGKRSAQFISSLVTLVNADATLTKIFYEAPMTVIQAGLKAASYDLPIDPALGFAYIVPFKNKKEDGSYRMEAGFIMGYKGLEQLCLRTGAYSRIPDAVDVREGELIHYDRLTGDCEFNWIEDEDEREKKPIIGYAGYFRLKNGAEKTIYMTRKKIEAHEKKNRKGQYMSKAWKDDFESMAKKTVLRQLISHYGLMSIDYQNANEEQIKAMQEAIYDTDETNPQDYITVDAETGEVNEE
ncbi:MAG: recombinase RecT [Clostridiales bacterium]|nr:recombinase RecT [Clostridiales bacterium]